MLFLTKPLGTGIVGTAIKFDRVDAALADEAVASMRTLNRAAAEALQALPAGAVHACTDITGFGLIGHASEMARASGVTLAIDAGAVPLFDGVLAIAGAEPSGGHGVEPGAFRGGVTVERGCRRRPRIAAVRPANLWRAAGCGERRSGRPRSRRRCARPGWPRSRSGRRRSARRAGVQIVVRP